MIGFIRLILFSICGRLSLGSYSASLDRNAEYIKQLGDMLELNTEKLIKINTEFEYSKQRERVIETLYNLFNIQNIHHKELSWEEQNNPVIDSLGQTLRTQRNAFLPVSDNELIESIRLLFEKNYPDIKTALFNKLFELERLSQTQLNKLDGETREASVKIQRELITQQNSRRKVIEELLENARTELLLVSAQLAAGRYIIIDDLKRLLKKIPA